MALLPHVQCLSGRPDEPSTCAIHYLKQIADFFQFYYHSPAVVLKVSSLARFVRERWGVDRFHFISMTSWGNSTVVLRILCKHVTSTWAQSHSVASTRSPDTVLSWKSGCCRLKEHSCFQMLSIYLSIYLSTCSHIYVTDEWNEIVPGYVVT